MPSINLSAALETNTGFTLDTDQLDTGVLGYLQTGLSAPIRSASWGRGRDSMLDGFSAGSCTVTFDNRDRLFDPKNTASSLYGQLYPGRGFTLYFGQGKANQVGFKGYVDSWEYDYTLEGDAIVRVNVLDAFSYLANKQITSISAPAELSGARVTRVLSNIGWPVSLQSIDKGFSTLAAETIANVSVLDYLEKVAQSEFGMFFVDAAGIIQFRQRNRVNQFSDLYISNTQDAFSYTNDISFDYSFDRVFNSVTLTNDNLTLTATATDSTSSNLYGSRPRTFDTLVADSTSLQSLANGIVALYGTPAFIARSATVNMDSINVTSGNNVFSVKRVSLGLLDVGYLTGVNWEPPGTVGGADPISIPALMIVGIRYDASPFSASVTVNLDYALGYDSLILDDPVKGVLDVNKLGV